MKIILLCDIKKLEKKDAIIDVADGYANFLIKSKKAVAATSGGVLRLKKEQLEKSLKDDELIMESEKIKNKLEKDSFKFLVKTGIDDRVFGSVSVKQILSKLEDKGYNIDKKQIKIKEPLSSLGFHNVNIELHKCVVATIKVELSKE